MTLSLKHNFHTTTADGVDATKVQPSNWNEEHALSMATNKVLGRMTAGTGTIEELAVTGTGNVVMSTNAALTTPDLGVPSAGNLANCSIPLAKVTGVAATVATAMATALSQSTGGADRLVGMKNGSLAIGVSSSDVITTPLSCGLLIFTTQSNLGSSVWVCVYHNNSGFVGVTKLNSAQSSGAVETVASVAGDSGGNNHITITVGNAGQTGNTTISWKLIAFD